MGKKDKKKDDKKRRLAACSGGYYKFHTLKTFADKKWGPWKCLSAAVPCAGTNAAAAKKQMLAQWVKNGGATFKYFETGYCQGYKQSSAPWKIGNDTWRFSGYQPSRRLVKDHQKKEERLKKKEEWKKKRAAWRKDKEEWRKKKAEWKKGRAEKKAAWKKEKA